jgi:hypothetical protein
MFKVSRFSMIFVINLHTKPDIMKAKIIPFFSILIPFAFLLVSCDETVYKLYTGNSPVFMSYEDLRSAVVTQQNVNLENPGKIYFKDDYIFIVEEQEGIHVYDNSNPSSPVKKTFVKVPGVVDISISGNILYADSYVDLVVLDLQDINNIHEVARAKDILPYTVPPVDNNYPMAWVDQEKGVVIGWEVKTIKERESHYMYPYPVYMEDGSFLKDVNPGGASGGISGSGIGAGGSMARFGIKGDVLYVLSQYEIKIFDITSKTNPVSHGSVYANWDSETMFLTDKYMFIGTASGMMIYDISVPLSPQSRTFFQHARSCDPVIVDDSLAYITLRTGTTCGGLSNLLTVVNIKNIDLPVPVMTYPLTNPYGLGKDGDLLFICDGSAGLKIYDASDPKTISSHLIINYSGINAYDVIPVGDLLILIGEDGLYQYDYSDVMNITLVSSILVD